MKLRTLEILHSHMETGRIYFPDNHPGCDFRLTNGEIRDIMSAEYGIRPKRNRIIKKKLKQLVNTFVRLMIKEYHGNQTKPQRSE